jgi:hypothetical protein
MPAFPLSTGPYVYRPLMRGLKGWDVYALQTGLGGLVLDGDFGPMTEQRTRNFQTTHGLVSDGRAGPKTQFAVAINHTPPDHGPTGLARGVFEFEGGNLLGNHSKLYGDGSRDFGVVQDNLPDFDREIGFDVPGRIAYYFHMLRVNHDRYKHSGYVPTDRRAWELAVGWWNRPAWTDRLAAGVSLTPIQSAWIEDYIARLLTYVVW